MLTRRHSIYGGRHQACTTMQPPATRDGKDRGSTTIYHRPVHSMVVPPLTVYIEHSITSRWFNNLFRRKGAVGVGFPLQGTRLSTQFARRPGRMLYATGVSYAPLPFYLFITKVFLRRRFLWHCRVMRSAALPYAAHKPTPAATAASPAAAAAPATAHRCGCV